MKTKKILYVLFLTLTVWLLSISIALAGFHITPSISIREEYNDNIYLTPDNEEDAFITTIIPALNLAYEAKVFTLSLDYSLHFKFYSNDSDLNETSLSRVQRVHLDSMVYPYRDVIFIHITDDYRRVPIDTRENYATDNELTNMTDSNTFTLNPYIIYPITNTIQARFDYIYENIWYKDSSGDDTENHTFSLGISKEFTSRLKGSVIYSYMIHNPDLTEDYDRQSIEGKVEYLASAKLTLQGGYGHTWFDYDISDDVDENFWSTGFDYKLSEALTLGLNYSVEFVESVREGTYKSKTVEGSLSYNKFVSSRLTASYSKDEYLDSDREDRSNAFAIDLSFPITDRLTNTLSASYGYYKFLPEDRKDHRYSARIAFEYEMKITTLSFGYTYNKNNSTMDTYDYDNNIVWIEAKLSLK